MNTDKVFTGFNNENKEILVYRENNESYIDLIKKQKINKDNIETLKYLKETIKVLKYMPESLIIKLYNHDRNKLIATKNILVGLKATITNLKEIKTESGWYFYGIPLHKYSYEWDKKDYEMGLYVYKDELIIDKEYKFKVYKNIYDETSNVGFSNDTNNISRLPEFNNGMSYIMFNGTTLKDVIKEPILEKKKVYELAYEARKEESLSIISK